MRALVVYESLFGNTRQIAEAIGDGLRERLDRVDVVEVGDAPHDLGGVELLVVGGPTHAWGMSRASTRDDARRQARERGIEPASAGIGIRDWLRGLGRPEASIVSAAFDTAIRPSGWFPVGSAARRAKALLARRGYPVAIDPEHFFVEATHGPLMAGEIERASLWAQALAAVVRRPAATSVSAPA